MKKAEFKSINFYYFLILVLIMLISYNLYSMLVSKDFFIMIPIVIQLSMLALNIGRLD